MLKEILKEISNSSYISKSSMALKLNTTKELIDDAFFQLTRMGYIKNDENNMENCTLGCKGCPFANTCNKTPIKSVTITEKGKKILNK